MEKKNIRREVKKAVLALPADVREAEAEQVMKALREAAEHPAVLAEPGVFAGISTYGDSAITYVLRAWCKTEDYWDLYFAMNSKVRETFANNGVEMTYPHINVHLDK
jgi:small conductance mechanosensitive channel